jgi:hypothetical protein
LAEDWLRDSGYRLLSVEAETADGSVNLLLAGTGVLPRLSQLEARIRPLLLGRSLVVKVLHSESFVIGRSMAVR